MTPPPLCPLLASASYVKGGRGRGIASVVVMHHIHRLPTHKLHTAHTHDNHLISSSVAQ